MAHGAQASKGPALPSGFISIADLLDGQGPGVGSLTNVVAMVRDCRLPVPMHTGDSKCTLSLCDLSTDETLNFNLFCPLQDMPQVEIHDIVILFQAKIQRFPANGPLSLLSNYKTSVCVFTAAKIPPAPRSAAVALQPSRRRKREPIDKETHYVSYLFHHMDKESLPSADEFQVKAAQSLRVKDKFSLLQDVQEHQFYDIVAQVAREPFDSGDKVTLYVSDYTENKSFFNYTPESIEQLAGEESNGYGGDSSGERPPARWHGPEGRRTMQITAFEPHATYINTHVEAGGWVLLRNVQVKYGKDGKNMEGYLRQDRGNPAKLNVGVLDTQDPEHADPRLKDAVRRLRDYGKRTKGTKRKAGGDPENESVPAPKNAKQRRQDKRKELQMRNEAERLEAAAALNQHVLCEGQGRDVTPVSHIIQPTYYDTTIDGKCEKLQMPFTCSKYLANVRVVDFRPRRLEDFAMGRVASALDCLGSDEEVSSHDESNIGRVGPRVWEWRFSLQLEDARPVKGAAAGTPPARFWVLVNNAEGQHLTGMDATDLREDPVRLDQLREKMFVLWGTMEEQQMRALAQIEQNKERGAGNRPDLDSDGEEDALVQGQQAVSNKPFACCIREYGVSVSKKRLAQAGASGTQKWERVFGLFGTRIAT